MKCCGGHLSGLLSGLEFSFNHAVISSNVGDDYHFALFDYDKDFVLSVASKGPKDAFGQVKLFEVVPLNAPSELALSIVASG